MEEGRQQRRSARISVLDTWRLSELTRASGAPRGRRGRRPFSSSPSPLAPLRGRKRGRKKRRLRAVVEVVDSFPGGKRRPGTGSDEKEEDNGEDDRHCQEQKEGGEKEGDLDVKKETQTLDQDDDLDCTDRSPGPSSMPWIPDKKTLELILDILQKKDAHEIFAEPVDAEEVEGYYEIIKEPMDFATMRAKLQEGMYATLEQFEGDVFLIFSNAMHFNATATIYYRQARAIQELAKKTFHRLKTDPENFVLDVTRKTKSGDILKKASKASGTSRAQGEPRSSDGSRSKFATNKRRRNGVPEGTAVATNEKHGSLCGSLSPGRSHYHTFLPRSSSPLADCKRDQDEDLLGCPKDGWSSFPEEERRSTYRSWSPSSSGREQLLPLCGGPMQLVYVNHGDFGYMESLARFASDLGPTARMVAQRKIGRCMFAEAPNAVASFPATRVQVSAGDTSACTASTGHHVAAEKTTKDQNLGSQPGPVACATVTRFLDSHITATSLPADSTARPDSRQLLASRPELASPVSQSRLLEIVSRNSNAWVCGNGDARQPAYCRDNAAAWPGLAKCMSRTTQAAELSQGFSSTRNGSWPRRPGSLSPSFCHQSKQPGVIDMSFIQARLNGLSSFSDRQWRAPEPTEPLVEVPGSPSQPISDAQQPDLALQL